MKSVYIQRIKSNKKKVEGDRGERSGRLILIDMTVGGCHGDVTPLKSSCSHSLNVRESEKKTKQKNNRGM